MLTLARLFRWELWSKFWYLVLFPARSIGQLLLWLGRSELTPPGEDVEHYGDTEEQSSKVRDDLMMLSEYIMLILLLKGTNPSSNPCSITIEERNITAECSSNRKLLMIGIFAEVYLLDDTVIRKAPRSNMDEDTQPIHREATIYSILGEHPRIAECLSFGSTDFVDIKYYPNGDLAAFVLNKKEELDFDHQQKWFRQIIEAVDKIHEHNIIHSDLALRQFFLDGNLDVLFRIRRT